LVLKPPAITLTTPPDVWVDLLEIEVLVVGENGTVSRDCWQDVSERGSVLKRCRRSDGLLAASLAVTESASITAVRCG
jgi:hypothetical protein